MKTKVVMKFLREVNGYVHGIFFLSFPQVAGHLVKKLLFRLTRTLDHEIGR